MSIINFGSLLEGRMVVVHLRSQLSCLSRIVIWSTYSTIHTEREICVCRGFRGIPVYWCHLRWCFRWCFWSRYAVRFVRPSRWLLRCNPNLGNFDESEVATNASPSSNYLDCIVMGGAGSLCFAPLGHPPYLRLVQLDSP